LNDAVDVNSFGCCVIRHNGIDGVWSGRGGSHNAGFKKTNYAPMASVVP
jgi:hypothetical protein